MLDRVRSWIKKVVWGHMFGKESVASAMNVELAVSSVMDTAIQIWNEAYLNKPDSLNLPSAIASELARLVTIEMKSEVLGSERAGCLNDIYQKTLSDIRNCTEYAAAGGGLIFKPYFSDGSIRTDYIRAGNFFPTHFDGNGKITGAIFVSQKTKGSNIFTRLEYHRFQESEYVVSNRAYCSQSASTLGSEIPLSMVPEWKDLNPSISIHGLKEPLFVYFKMPFANVVDPDSPLGVSVYARALDVIWKADQQYKRILWEYEGAELAVDVDSTSFRRDKNGKLELPKGKERLFRVADFGDDKDRYHVYSPAIRDSSLFNGLNQLFMHIEDNCGLARGTFSDPQSVAKTATELNILRQRSYSTVADTQKALQNALINYLEVLDTLISLYHLAPPGKWEASFEWDDSIVADRRAEFVEKQQLVTMGILKPWEFRMWYTGETEEQAKANCLSKVDLSNPFQFNGGVS